jgi:hypothetical protein
MVRKNSTVRGRTALWVGTTIVATTLVTASLLNFTGVLSPVTPGPDVRQLAWGQADLPAVYTLAEGDGSFPWDDSLGPLTFFIGWHAGFATSVCLVNSPGFVNYSTCEALGGTMSPFEESGQITVGLVNASYPVESYSFIEPPAYSDVALGVVQVNYSGGSDVSFRGQLAVLSSFPISTTWSADTFPLPSSDDHFEFWFNDSLPPISTSRLTLLGTDGAICAFTIPSGPSLQFWTCTGVYDDVGRPTFQPEVTYTTSENATAYFDLWAW